MRHLFSPFRSRKTNGRRRTGRNCPAFRWMRETASRVDRLARTKRHQKLFNLSAQPSFLLAKILLCFTYLRRFWQNFSARSKAASKQLFSGHQGELLSPRQNFKRICVVVMVFFLIGSINLGYAHSDFSDNIDSQYYLGDEGINSFITDDEGYLVKAVPSEMSGGVYGNRDGLILEHQIQSGQTLSQIAERYGVKTRTIIWANDIANPDRLTEGKILSIPRTDGMLYRVKMGDTVDKIAKRYGISEDKIRIENKLDGDLITLNQIILLPGGAPLNPTPEKSRLLASTKKAGSTRGRNLLPAKPSDKIVALKKGTLFFPATGRVTQGFGRRHYGLDIANRDSNVPVYAAASGTVIRAEGGGAWHGGYGNVLVIQHDNGLQTLYAHLKTMYVSTGDKVKQGQAIALMGNTGRSTGPHVHFEVVDHGEKKNPWNYVSQ